MALRGDFLPLGNAGISHPSTVCRDPLRTQERVVDNDGLHGTQETTRGHNLNLKPQIPKPHALNSKLEACLP